MANQTNQNGGLQRREWAEVPMRQIVTNPHVLAAAACSFAIGSAIPFIAALIPQYMREELGVQIEEVREGFRCLVADLAQRI